MSFEEFQATLRDATPPVGVNLALRALWHDAQGNWESAHHAVQDDSSPAGAWVHAYLHRKEGDLGNAGYWYRGAGRPQPPQDLTLAAEWAAIARALLAR